MGILSIHLSNIRRISIIPLLPFLYDSYLILIPFLSHSNPKRLERDWYGIGIRLERDWN